MLIDFYSLLFCIEETSTCLQNLVALESTRNVFKSTCALHLELEIEMVSKPAPQEK
jgi:hypothetical protein